MVIFNITFEQSITRNGNSAAIGAITDRVREVIWPGISAQYMKIIVLMHVPNVLTEQH